MYEASRYADFIRFSMLSSLPLAVRLRCRFDRQLGEDRVRLRCRFDRQLGGEVNALPRSLPRLIHYKHNDV